MINRTYYILLVAVVFWLVWGGFWLEPAAIWRWCQALLLAFAWWFPLVCLGKFIEALAEALWVDHCRCAWCQAKGR